MSSYLFKIYSDGIQKIYEDGITDKIYEQFGNISCLKELLQIIHYSITDINYDNYIAIAPQDQAYPIITVSMEDIEYDKYIPSYRFSVSIIDTITNCLDIGEDIEVSFDGLDCLHRTNEIGPSFLTDTGAQKIFQATMNYQWICNVSGAN